MNRWGVGGACIFASILQTKWAAYTSNGIFGVPSVNKRLGLVVESRLTGRLVRFKLYRVPKIDGMYGFCRFLMALAGAALLNTPYFARSGAGYLKQSAYALSLYAIYNEIYAKWKLKMDCFPKPIHWILQRSGFPTS